MEHYYNKALVRQSSGTFECKRCYANRNSNEHYHKHHDRLKEYHRIKSNEYYHKNNDHYKEYNRKYYSTPDQKAKARISKKRYYEANKVKISIQMKKYYQANREKLIAKALKYYYEKKKGGPESV